MSDEKRAAAVHQVILALRHAEAQHWEKHGTYGDLNALKAAGLSPVAEGEVERESRYTFRSVARREQYTIVAMPPDGTRDFERYTLTETGDIQSPSGLQTVGGAVRRVDVQAGMLTVSLNRDDGMRPGVLCEVTRVTGPVCLAICIQAGASASVLQPGEMKAGTGSKKTWRPDKATAKLVHVGDEVPKVTEDDPAR